MCYFCLQKYTFFPRWAIIKVRYLSSFVSPLVITNMYAEHKNEHKKRVRNGADSFFWGTIVSLTLPSLQ